MIRYDHVLHFIDDTGSKCWLMKTCELNYPKKQMNFVCCEIINPYMTIYTKHLNLFHWRTFFCLVLRTNLKLRS